MTRRPSYELILALLAVLAITLGYVYIAQEGVPDPGGWIGHSLGIVGFVLMIATETIYTLRKKMRRFTLGTMSTWLNIHIFTGIVGPYLVLLHSAGKFNNNIAGVVSLLTVLMVLSGFIGRYIYTAAPRSVDGAEMGVEGLEQQFAQTDYDLYELGVQMLGSDLPASLTEAPKQSWFVVLARHYLRWRQRRRVRAALIALKLDGHPESPRLEQLLLERFRLLMEIDSLIATRQLLAVWHLFHVPLGVLLFCLAFLHVAAALYYATFLK